MKQLLAIVVTLVALGSAGCTSTSGDCSCADLRTFEGREYVGDPATTATVAGALGETTRIPCDDGGGCATDPDPQPARPIVGVDPREAIAVGAATHAQVYVAADLEIVSPALQSVLDAARPD